MFKVNYLYKILNHADLPLLKLLEAMYDCIWFVC